MAIFKNYLERLLQVNTDADAEQNGATVALATIVVTLGAVDGTLTGLAAPEATVPLIAGPIRVHLTTIPLKVEPGGTFARIQVTCPDPLEGTLAVDYVELALTNIAATEVLVMSPNDSLDPLVAGFQGFTVLDFENRRIGTDLTITNGDAVTTAGGVFTVSCDVQLTWTPA